MSEEVKTYYCYCDDHCKYATFTAEQIVGLLEYVIANDALPNDLIIDGTIDSSTKIAAVNYIYEQNHNKALKVWVGTQAEWDSYTGDKSDVFAIITDDQTKEQIIDTVNANSLAIANINNGVTPVSIKKDDGTMQQLIRHNNNLLSINDGTIVPTYKILSNTNVIISNETGESLTYTTIYETTENILHKILRVYVNLEVSAEEDINVEAGVATPYEFKFEELDFADKKNAYVYANPLNGAILVFFNISFKVIYEDSKYKLKGLSTIINYNGLQNGTTVTKNPIRIERVLEVIE